MCRIAQGHGLPVLGSDTIVVLEGELLGKPLNESDAFGMLKALSGRSHEVVTGISMCREKHAEIEILNKVVSTKVQFAQLSEKQIRAYIQTGEPMDKAGAYGIQGKAAVFIESIQGSYSNVVGLPLCETAQLLAQFNVPIWNEQATIK